jgi:RimJ/RimL family protein N-acetyltransferase
MIETRRLLLRDVLRADAEGFHAYRRREAYWQHVPMEPPTRKQIDEFLEQCLREQEESPRSSYCLAATLKDTNEIVGEALLRIRSARHCQGEMGWAVAEFHQGKGLATEIGLALLRFGFDEIGLHRIFARTRCENLASRRVMAKIGMREEGILRENVRARGAWWSSVQCSILVHEYGAAPAPVGAIPADSPISKPSADEE